MAEKETLTGLVTAPGFLMINTAWRIKDELRKAFAAEGHDVTLDQFAVLIRLWQEDGLSQTELCEKTCKTKSNMTRILDSMEKKGLISRRVNREDRRSFSIYLTQKGRDIKNQLVPIAMAMNDRVFKKVTAADRRSLLKMLDTISNNLG